MRIPHTKLSPTALRAVVEEFVTRDGTDHSSVETRAESVLRQLDAGQVELHFDGETRTCNILPAGETSCFSKNHGTSSMYPAALVRTILSDYQLPWHGIHGVTHWARVMENGLRLASVTGAKREVVWLFAVFHDARRINEGWDPDHGRRGADLAESLRGTAFDLPDDDFALLRNACDYHTDGLTEGDVTVQTCWDADRLDLWRVGIWPDPRKLCTDAAKDQAIIEWSRERSVRRHAPEFVAMEWGNMGNRPSDSQPA